MTTCVVFLSNFRYIAKFIDSCQQLVTVGKYSGPICLIIDDSLVGRNILNHSVIVENKVIVKHFPNIVFPDWFINFIQKIERPSGLFEKAMIVLHKYHIFNVFFKQWDYILYIDTGASFFNPIQPLLDTKLPGTLLAHSNVYPAYKDDMNSEFAPISPYIEKLRSKYNLNVDYPQSTLMLYDTSIITDTTFDELYNLTLEYPISIQSEQGIMALYFVHVRNIWKQIPIGDGKTFFYDFHRRNGRPKTDYIVLKYPDSMCTLHLEPGGMDNMRLPYFRR
jgi:hypothetical protein